MKEVVFGPGCVVLLACKGGKLKLVDDADDDVVVD